MTLRLHRTLPILLLALAVPSVAAAPAAAKAPGQRCNQLKGTDLFPDNPEVRVVEGGPLRGEDDEWLETLVYRACAGRFGKVRVVNVVKDNPDFITSDQPEASGGRFFIMSSSFGFDDEEQSTALTLYDARTGEGRVIRETDPNAGGLGAPEQVFFDVQAIVLDRNGTSVVVFGQEEGELGTEAGLPAGTTRYVAAFDRRGRRTLLDTGGSEIAPNTLRLRAGVATWAHGAERRRHEVRASACSSDGLTATGASGGVMSSVAVGRLRVSGTGCRSARGLAGEVARLSLAGDPATSAQGYALAFTRPCAGCSPVTGVVATKGPRRVTFQLRGGEG
jgi:hypothetical protein